MKTHRFINRRALIVGNVISIFISLLLVSNKAFSQNNYTTKINDTCVLVSFTEKRVEEINYLNCTIRSTIKGYFLVLEKSIDGETFFPLAIKRGEISPKDQLLQFSFTDSSSTSAEAIYKIGAYKSSMTNTGEQNYFCVSENLLKEFDHSVVSINALVTEAQQQNTGNWE